MNTAEKILHTVSDYFDFEQSQEGKFEYHNGEIVSMAGGTKNHIRISMNLGNRLDDLLDGSNCAPYNSDLKVRSEAYNSYYYPDCTVVCNDEQDGNESVESNPMVIIEVLSKSTESYDRGQKLEAYRSIPSLQAYLLVSQDEPKVEIYTRAEHGEFWKYISVKGLENEFLVESIGVKLKLKDIYKNVSFEVVVV